MIAPHTSFRTSHAILIAIDDYRAGVPRLRNAVRDALVVGRTLGAEQGFVVQALFDENATRASVRALLAKLITDVCPGDRIVVYVACHGLSIGSTAGPEGHLLLHDAQRDDISSYFPMKELHNGLTALRSKHLLVVLDCCFAGAFRWASMRDLGFVVPMFRETYARFIESPAKQVITSAASDQRAFDAFGDRGGEKLHSPFAEAFLDGLRGHADLDHDGIIAANELYWYVRRRVETATDAHQLQSPLLFALEGHERGEFVFQVPNHTLLLRPAPALTPEMNPYRGLESFDAGTRGLFFGRERVVRRLARTVLRHTLTVVVGPSGCGKSSVLLAGLAPMFQRRSSTARRNWTSLTLRALDLAGTADLELPAGRVVVIVDQFEDLVTQAEPQQRAAVLALLERWLELRRVRLVLALRSDFEPQLGLEPMSARWGVARFVIPPMTAAQLRRVIEGPAAARELTFDPPSIVDELVDEVVQMPGALPLLSVTLSELYRERHRRQHDDRSIRPPDVKNVGGVTRALTLRASEVLDALISVDPRYEQTARKVMLRMISSVGGGTSRRRVSWDELQFSAADEQHRVTALINKFVEARLLVGDRGDDGAWNHVEPAHDGLVLGWTRLSTWTRESEAELAIARKLAADAEIWERNGHRGGDLWQRSNPSLPQAIALADSSYSPFNRRETEFVRASERRRHWQLWGLALFVAGVVAALAMATWITSTQRDVAREAQGREASARKDLEAENRIVTARALALTAAALLEKDDGPALQQAALVAIESLKLHTTPQADALIRSALALHPTRVPVAPIPRVTSRPGKYATIYANGTARLLDPATGQELVFFRRDGIVDLIVSSDHRWLAVIDKVTPKSDEEMRRDTLRNGSNVTLWDLRTRKPVSLPEPVGGPTRARLKPPVAFSADGKLIAAATSQTAMAVWSLAANPAKVLVRYSPASAFSDVTRVALAGGETMRLVMGTTFGTVEVVEPGETTGELHSLFRWEGETFSSFWRPVESLATDPLGHLVTASFHRGSTRVWDIDANRELARVDTHDSPVTRSALVEPNRLVLWRGTIEEAWSFALREESIRFPAASVKNSVVFDPTGERLAFPQERQIEVASVARAHVDLHVPVDGIPIAFAGGRLVIEHDQGLERWTLVGTPTRLDGLPLSPISRAPHAISVDRGSGRAAVLLESGSVAVVDLDLWTTSKVFPVLHDHSVVHSPLSHEAGPVNPLPDGLTLARNRVVVWYGDGSVTMFSTTGERMFDLPPRPTLSGFARIKLTRCVLDATGERLVTLGRDGEVNSWKLSNTTATWQHRILTKGTALNAAFSPTGRLLALVEHVGKTKDRGDRYRARIFTTGPHSPVATELGADDVVHALPERTESAWSVAFSPDERFLALNGGGVTVLETLDEHRLVADACRRIGRDLTPLEWSTLVKDSSRTQRKCTEWPQSKPQE